MAWCGLDRELGQQVVVEEVETLDGLAEVALDDLLGMVVDFGGSSGKGRCLEPDRMG